MDSIITASDVTTKVTSEFTLTADRAARVQQLAAARQTSESEVVEKALDVFFSLADFLDADIERQDWHRLSETSLRRLWDNEQDAVYDNMVDLASQPIVQVQTLAERAIEAI